MGNRILYNSGTVMNCTRRLSDYEGDCGQILLTALQPEDKPGDAALLSKALWLAGQIRPECFLSRR